MEQGISLIIESYLSVYENCISHILKEYFFDLSSCISQLSGGGKGEFGRSKVSSLPVTGGRRRERPSPDMSSILRWKTQHDNCKDNSKEILRGLLKEETKIVWLTTIRSQGRVGDSGSVGS